MFTDITGIPLVPGNGGRHCPGNGTTLDSSGAPIECCCDQCDYILLCFPEYDRTDKNKNKLCFVPEIEKNTCKFP